MALGVHDINQFFLGIVALATCTWDEAANHDGFEGLQPLLIAPSECKHLPRHLPTSTS